MAEPSGPARAARPPLRPFKIGRTAGAVLVGVDARLVAVEIDLPGGLPTLAAIGLLDPAVREGIDRVRSAVRNAGYALPDGRIVVSVAPADMRKEGAGLDLPIAAALLAADGQIRTPDPRKVLLAGELALDGSVRPVRGALQMAQLARAEGRSTLIVPEQNVGEAALVAGLEVVPIAHLTDLGAWSRGHARRAPCMDAASLLAAAQGESEAHDLSEVRGQAAARRALEVAAAGGHNLLFVGPPGAGKTMLARRLPGILPSLELEEALTVTRAWSAAGLTQGLVTRRPFRAPHHTISFPGMTGGGARLRPGEMTLASGGVLFLDELTEFRRDVLEALRQPLEERSITVVRLHAAATFPADFMLVASMNPCPCGWHGEPSGRCSCAPAQLARHRARLSGPLLDRFDLVVEVPAVELKTLARAVPGEASSAVRTRVVEARRVQRERLGRVATNASLWPGELERHASIEGSAGRTLLAACERLGVTARGFDRVRRVARTIADLEGSASVESRHVAEALCYRVPPGWRGG